MGFSLQSFGTIAYLTLSPTWVMSVGRMTSVEPLWSSMGSTGPGYVCHLFFSLISVSGLSNLTSIACDVGLGSLGLCTEDRLSVKRSLFPLRDLLPFYFEVDSLFFFFFL